MTGTAQDTKFVPIYANPSLTRASFVGRFPQHSPWCPYLNTVHDSKPYIYNRCMILAHPFAHVHQLLFQRDCIAHC
jgi:hypothetical protein